MIQQSRIACQGLRCRERWIKKAIKEKGVMRSLSLLTMNTKLARHRIHRAQLAGQSATILMLGLTISLYHLD